MRVSVFSYLSDLLTLSDEEAMLRVQRAGDRRAFTLLVRRWQGRIERLCGRLTGDAHRGEDLAQEVFMRIYAHRTDYRHNGRFAAYARRIALNACYDEYRRARRIREIPLEQSGDREDSSGICLKAVEQSPDAVAADNERDELIRKALFSLPESYRTVIILRHYQRLRFREIAEVLEIPMGTVKSRMAEGLARLGRQLKAVLNDQQEISRGINETVKPTGKEMT